MNSGAGSSTGVGPSDDSLLSFANKRLTLHAPIGVGGMASVHIGRLGVGAECRTVAVKRPHPHLAANPSFIAMLVDEARLTLRIKHPNVVETLEVILEASDLLLVMEYVHGEVLAHLLEAPRVRGHGLPPAIAAAIVIGAAEGLHAAHATTSDDGDLLGIVHRDVSPHNIIVGVDGRPRVLDFGIAKAAGRVHTTREDQLKGKLRYMAPELLEGHDFDHRADVFALGIVFWECLTGQSLLNLESDGAAVRQLVAGKFDAPSSRNPALPPAVDDVARRALALSPADRPATAAAFAAAVREAITPASEEQVAAWLAMVAPAALAERAALIRDVELAVANEPSESAGVASKSIVPPPQQGLRPTRWGRLVLAAVLASAVLAGVAMAARSFPRGPIASEGSPSSILATAPPIAESPSAVAAPGSEDAAAPTTSATNSAPVTSAPVTSAPTARPRTRPHHGPKRPKVNCTPPHYVDARGIKHFRPECLR